MRPGVPRDEPPNFWTSTGRVTDSGSALNITLPRQPFRQEDRAFARTELGVVREDDILDAFERRLVAHAANRDRHAVARIAVPPRLWPEGIGGDLQQSIGRRGQTLEPVDTEPLHRGGSRRRIDGTLGADEDGFQVAVGDVDPCAGTGDGEWRGLAPVTKDLLRLALDLLLLARDEGNDVVDHVECQDSALAARSRDRLERGHHHGAHAEGVMQRLQRYGQPGGRTVGDRRDEAAPAARAALVMEGLGMRIIDAGDQDRDVGLVAKGGGGADDRHPFRKAWLPDFGDLFGNGAEDQVERLGEELLIVETRQGEQRGVGAALGKPAAGTRWVAQRVAERFSRRAFGGADRGHTEPWVPIERGQYLLPREAAGAEDADAQALAHATTAGAFSAAASACSKSAVRAFSSCRRCPSRTSKSSVVLRPPAGSLKMPSVCASSAIPSWTASSRQAVPQPPEARTARAA